MGVAWYRCSYGASKSSGDSGLTQYLSKPGRWRHLDPKLFVTLKKLVYRGTRSVAEIQASEILGNATFHDEPVDVEAHPGANTKRRRDEWFEDVMEWLHGCDLVFADPDNGLCRDDRFNAARAGNAKRIPLRELTRLAEGRAAIVYHHFHRSYSHSQQLRECMDVLPECQYVYRWQAWMPRAFFLINTDEDIKCRLEAFATKWEPHGSLVRREDL